MISSPSQTYISHLSVLHPLWFFLSVEDDPVWCPQSIIFPLIKYHTFFCAVQERLFGALVDCQLHLLCGGEEMHTSTIFLKAFILYRMY